MTAGCPAVILALIEETKSRAGVALDARAFISANGTRARRASTSARLVARIRCRMSLINPS